MTTLRARPATWLVTGAAGFIGSHLTEQLLKLDQTVVALDNFATGFRSNLREVLAAVSPEQHERFRFIDGDIRNLAVCRQACDGSQYVLHQAALGSVPRSIDDPVATNATNIAGFVNMLVAARDAGARRFVYAASSAAYGDDARLPKTEDVVGAPLSPYAVTKVANELYARVFETLYGIECVGLRYFNVFGPRQDPNGAYAAVIPRWLGRLVTGETCQIFGDGLASRDFCFVANAVQANILAATCKQTGATGQVYNIACGDRTTLNDLFRLITERVRRLCPDLAIRAVEHAPPRPGDVLHSMADISKARRLLHYQHTHTVAAGLDATVAWFVQERTSARNSVAPR